MRGDNSSKGAIGRDALTRRDFHKMLAVGAGAVAAGTLVPRGLLSSLGRLGAAKATQGKPIKIGFLSSEVAAYSAVRALYLKTPDAVGVTLAPIASSGFSTLLPRALGAGTATDVFEVSPGNGNTVAIDNLAPSGYLTDLSDQAWVKLIPKSVMPVCQVNGKVVMCPVTGGVMVMFYNKKIFNSLGISVPTTWPEFLSVCAKLKAAGKIPIWLDASNGGVGTLFLTYQLAASTDVGAPGWAALRAAKKTTFTKSGWSEALEKFVTLYKDGYFSPDAAGGAPQSQLASGKAAMFGLVSQAYSMAETNFGSGNIGTFLLPNTNTASGLVACSGSGYGLAVNAKSADPVAAKAFIHSVASPAGQKAFNLALGGVPLLPAEPGAVPSAFADVVPKLRAGRTATYYDQQWPNAEVQQALIKGSVELMTGQATIPDVLQSMDQAYDAGKT
jgi:raffinose/stachyose/melibiose transport system substrate-binding protein